MNFPKTALLAIIVFASAPLLADVKYRAGYEVNFDDGNNSDGSIQTRSWLSATDPIVHEFGKYSVSILLGEVTDTTYSIIITVERAAATALPEEIVRQSFEGTFAGILEFSSKNGPIEIDGAIAVNRLEE